ncbi:hypothetical protein [Variovorax sp. HJSM1_2]|uniref:hypothetical protein n=1 Tax=Variovorax sp. HJSM1_2 TaxID=3366263 RepID=UPI003BBEC433
MPEETVVWPAHDDNGRHSSTLGSVFPWLGYWRIGLFNMGNACVWRERNHLDALVRAVRNDSRMPLTLRLYLTVGTQF